MPVLNKYKLKPGQTGVYIGRGSIWGNPFKQTLHSVNRNR